MKSTVGMKSVPADMIVFDELDEATPDARAMAWERIAHSDYKRVIELSNPSLPGYGIDEQFEKSDQRHWTLKCPACGHWTSLEREFPDKLGQEVRIILPREDGTYYRACPNCEHELDVDQGEWVADFPDRAIHGYRISQLFSTKVDPGEILEEYRTVRYPERFYNLKIGIPWADLERRLDVQSVLACCSTQQPPDGYQVMGVDTGKRLHVVVLRTNMYQRDRGFLTHLAVCDTYEELEALMKKQRVLLTVIDGMPEMHAARDLANRYGYKVYMNFFSESQHGSAHWNDKDHTSHVNRTEALDASRAAIRDRRIQLPPESELVREFARHLSCDAKQLEEDPDTGAKKYRYVRTGENHFSMAFTYALMAFEKVSLPIDPAVLHRVFGGSWY
jgi:hypothetical protein